LKIAPNLGVVIMDIETYSRREEDLTVAERLAAAERARAAGTKGYTAEEFERHMRDAIDRGSTYVDDVQDCRQDDDKNLI
jgi:hypothetical protein